jgi:hypothetical protein
VIPNFQTVSNPDAPFKRLTAKEKWDLCWRGSLDPFTGVSALIGSASSQKGNNDPKYGNGARGFAERFGAAMTDFSTQNLFSGFVLATLLHEDPRYYRKGPKTNLLGRVGYAALMTVVAKSDSGKWGPNLAGVGGGMELSFRSLLPVRKRQICLVAVGRGLVPHDGKCHLKHDVGNWPTSAPGFCHTH